MTEGIDQLVSFETAQLAREKGFDLFCQNAFGLKFKQPLQWDEVQDELNSGEEIGIPTGYRQEYMIKHHRTWKNRPNQPQILARPTQTTLHKWLREVHGIYIELIVDGWGDNEIVSAEHIGYRAFIWQIGKPKPHHNDDLGMHIYEKIMEVALYDALKLIH